MPVLVPVLAPVLVLLAVLAVVALLALAVGRLVARDGLGHRPGPRSRHDVWCPGGVDGPDPCGC